MNITVKLWDGESLTFKSAQADVRAGIYFIIVGNVRHGFPLSSIQRLAEEQA
jgi:hypothetical protein